MRNKIWMAVLGLAGFSQALPALEAKEGRLLDLNGKQIVLRGVALTNQWWGRWVWPLSDSLQAAGKVPLIRYTRTVDWSLDSLDYAHLRELAPNVVRYEFSYELFESANASRDSNLADLRAVVRRLEAQGTYTLLCMSGAPGLDVAKQGSEDSKPGAARVKSVFESDSLERLWGDVWTGLAQDFRGDAAIAGFELLNEPRLPAKADISFADASAKYVRLLGLIRAIDPGRLVFVPEFHGREANPGETYWSPSQKKNVIDAGEQGVIWTQSWPEIPDTVPGVVSVFHAYFPWDFCEQGVGTFEEDEFRKEVRKHEAWPKAHGRPVAVTEYGASHKLVLKGLSDRRLEWYRMVHRVFADDSLSTTAFVFKGEIGPYTSSNEFSLWVQYRGAAKEMRVSKGKPKFFSGQDSVAASKNFFDTILVRYLIQDDTVVERSCLGSGPVLEELARYFGGPSTGIRPSRRSVDLTVGVVRDGLQGLVVSLPAGVRQWRVVDAFGKVSSDGIVPLGAVELRLSRPRDRISRWLLLGKPRDPREIAVPLGF